MQQQLKSVAPVALLAPGIAANVIPVRLPETWLLLGLKRDATNPFRALPEIEVRHQQPDRAAVLRVNWLAVVQHREIIDDVLPGWNARARYVVATLALEAARDESHHWRQSSAGPSFFSNCPATSPGFGNRPLAFLLKTSSPSSEISKRPWLALTSSTARMIGAHRPSSSPDRLTDWSR